MKSEIRNTNTIESGEVNRINWFNPTTIYNSQNSSPRSTLENSYGTYNCRRGSDLDQVGNRKIITTKTKLIASIRRKFSSKSIINFLKEGIRIFRINGELFNHKEYSKVIKEINAIFEKENLNEKPTIIFDLKGPMPMITNLNINTQDDTDGVLHVRKGQVIKLAYDSGSKKIEEDNVICVDKKIANALRQGDEIVINNTKVVLKVIGFDRFKISTMTGKNATDRKNLEKYRSKIFRNILRREGDDMTLEYGSHKDIENIFRITDSNLYRIPHTRSHSNLRTKIKKENENLEFDVLLQNLNVDSNENKNENLYEDIYRNYHPICQLENDYKDVKITTGVKKINMESEFDPYDTFPDTPNTEANFKKLEKAFQSFIKKQLIRENFESSHHLEDNISNSKDLNIGNTLEKDKIKNLTQENSSFPYRFLFNRNFKMNVNNPKDSLYNIKSRNRNLVQGKLQFNENEFLSKQIKLFKEKNFSKNKSIGDNVNSNTSLHMLHRISSINNNLHKLEKETSIKKNNITVCEVKSEGTITEYKKLSVIHRDLISSLGTPVIGAKDIIDISKSAELGVNFISCLVNNASNIHEINDLLPEEFKNTVKILARIETTEAVLNFNEILEKVDGVIIFHGVFSNRIPVSDLISVESYMIEKCKMNNKLLVFQTENIFENSRKFISELNTIDSMIKEGFDGIILREGNDLHFSKNLNIIALIKEIMWQSEYEVGIKESSLQDDFQGHLFGFISGINHLGDKKDSINTDLWNMDSIFKSVVQASYSIDADIIIFYSDDPSLVKILSKLHPKCLILYPTCENNVAAYISVIRGVLPYLLDRKFNMDDNHEQDFITKNILENINVKINLGGNSVKKIIVVTAFIDFVKKMRNSMVFFVSYV